MAIILIPDGFTVAEADKTINISLEPKEDTASAATQSP